MFRKVKQSVAVLLVVTLFMTMFTISPNAAETQESNTSIDTSDYSISGTNSFGNMISSEIAESQQNISNVNDDYNLCDVTVEGNKANVKYNSLKDCTILVAIYDEKTDEMIASGKADASADNDTVDVYIQTEKMPPYFVTKVYMLDDNNYPLSECLVDELYTQGIQEVVALDASEFDKEKVLNLDDDTSTNFAVYNDDTTVISASEYNIPYSVDEENGIYIFTNCNETLTSLVSGDTFTYEYEDGNVLIVKVKDINVDGTTATITEDKNIKLEDVFDYVKIESSQTLDNAEVDMSSSSEGVTCEYNTNSPSSVSDKEVSSVGARYSGEESMSLKFPIDLFGDSDENGISGEASVGLSLTLGIDVYINNKFWEFNTHYIDFKMEYGATIDFKITAQVEKLAKTLATLRFVPVTGVNIVLQPKIAFSANAELSFSMGMVGSFGFNASFANGVQNTSASPSFKCDGCSFKGEAFVGLDFCPSLNIISSKVAEASLDMTIGATIEAEPTKAEEDEEHECNICFSGTLAPKASLSVSVTLVNKTVGSFEKSFKLCILDFYFSVDHMKFGWGKCPYIFTRMCGPKAYWKLSENGILTIYGEGTTNNYSSTSVPWKLYREKINTVVIEEGITSIGGYLFYSCSNMTDITIPDGIKSIGKDAFCFCTNLKNVYIPSSVTEIGRFAFENCTSLISTNIPNGITEIDGLFLGCKSLTNVTIPESVTMIGDYSFENCENLPNIEIPKYVTYIGWAAFKGCKSLKNISIPDGVTSLERSVFANSGLTSITIPSQIKHIWWSFDGCTDLKTIYFLGDRPGINDNSFTGVTATAYYPAGNSTYKYWADYRPNNFYGGIITFIPSDVSSYSVGSLPQNISESSAASDIKQVNAEFQRIANVEYIISVVKDKNAQDVFSADNLLYITQVTADANGRVSASMPAPSNVTDYDIVIFGPEKGDVNQDGQIDISDATYIQKYIANFVKFDIIQTEVADINKDGDITIDDVTMLQKYIAQIITTI